MKKFLFAFLLTALLSVTTSVYANDIDAQRISDLISLSPPTSPYANDIDGLWVSDGPLTKDSSWFMMKEHENSILVINITPANNTYIAWLGPFDKTTSLARLNQLNYQTPTTRFLFSFDLSIADSPSSCVPTLPKESQVTLTFTSSTTVTIELTECRDFPEQNHCTPIGTAITATKFY